MDRSFVLEDEYFCVQFLICVVLLDVKIESSDNDATISLDLTDG